MRVVRPLKRWNNHIAGIVSDWYFPVGGLEESKRRTLADAMSTQIPALLCKVNSLSNKEKASTIMHFCKYMQDRAPPKNMKLIISR
jgi:hypothetical protein